jgi:hypothetical protein
MLGKSIKPLALPPLLVQPAGRSLEGGGVASGGLRDLIPAIARTGVAALLRRTRAALDVTPLVAPYPPVCSAVHSTLPPFSPVVHRLQPWRVAWMACSWRCTTTPPPRPWMGPRSGPSGAAPSPPPLPSRLTHVQAGRLSPTLYAPLLHVALCTAGLVCPNNLLKCWLLFAPLSAQAPAAAAGGAAGHCQGQQGQGGDCAGPEPCGRGL